MLVLPDHVEIKQIRLADDWLADVGRGRGEEWPVMAWATIERLSGRLDVVGLALRLPQGRDLVIAEDEAGFLGYRARADRVKAVNDRDLSRLSGLVRLVSPVPIAEQAAHGDHPATLVQPPTDAPAPAAGPPVVSEPAIIPPVDLASRLKAWSADFEAGLAQLALTPYVRRQLIQAATPGYRWTREAFLRPASAASAAGEWVERLMPFDEWVRTVAAVDEFRLSIYDIRRFSQGSYLKLQAAARAYVDRISAATAASTPAPLTAADRLRAWSRNFVSHLPKLQLPTYVRQQLIRAATPTAPTSGLDLPHRQAFMLAAETGDAGDWTTRLLAFEDWVRWVASVDAFREVFYPIGRVGPQSYDQLVVKARDYLARSASAPPPAPVIDELATWSASPTYAEELLLLTRIADDWDCRQVVILERHVHDLAETSSDDRPERALARLTTLGLVDAVAVSKCNQRCSPARLLALTPQGLAVVREQGTTEPVLAYQRYLAAHQSTDTVYLMLQAVDLLTQAGYVVNRFPAEIQTDDHQRFKPDLVAFRENQTIVVGLHGDGLRGTSQAVSRWRLHCKACAGDIHVIALDRALARQVRSEIMQIRFKQPVTVFVTDPTSMAEALCLREPLWGAARVIN